MLVASSEGHTELARPVKSGREHARSEVDALDLIERGLRGAGCTGSIPVGAKSCAKGLPDRPCLTGHSQRLRKYVLPPTGGPCRPP